MSFTKHLDLNQLYTNSSQKFEEEGTLPNSFYEISLPWYQSQIRMLQENKTKTKKPQANIPDQYRCKNTSKLNSTAHWKIIYNNQEEFTSEIQGWVNSMQHNKCDIYINVNRI